MEINVQELRFHVDPSLAEKLEDLLVESKVSINTGLATMMYLIALQIVEGAISEEDIETRMALMGVLLSMAVDKAIDQKEEENDRTTN